MRARERVLQPLGAQLQQQALAQVARADAGRIELVDAVQRALDDLEVLAALEGDLLDRQLQIAVLVHVADQQRGDGLLLLVERIHLQLPEEVLGERLGAHQHALQARALLVVVVGRRRRGGVPVVAVVGEVVVPVDGVQPALGLQLGGGLALRGRLRPLLVALAAVVVEPLLGARRLLDRLLLGAALEVLLEDRILLQLLVDQLLELGARHLQDLDRLAQLGGHDQLLAELLNEFGFQCHRFRPYRLKRSPKYNSRALRLAAITSGVPSSRITPSLRIYARSQIPSVSLHVVVGDQNPDAALAQLGDDRLDVEHGDRIDAGEGLVEQHEGRRGDQRAADLDAAPLAAGQRVGVVLGQMRDARAPRAGWRAARRAPRG